MHTKLSLGLGVLLLSCLSFNNFDSKTIAVSESNTIAITPKMAVTITEVNQQNPGKEVYEDFCMVCHGPDGKGIAAQFPPLAGSDYLSKKRKESIHGVKFGQSGEMIVNKIKYNNVMPPLGLSNKEIADVMNYIMNSWGNKKMKPVTEKEVEKVLK
jgi:mono/diheme cytochrome c family protein